MKQQTNSITNNRKKEMHVKNMSAYVIGFQQIDKTKLAIVGGKGANLGELLKVNGIQVPEGFCVTTEAYRKIVRNNEEFKTLLDELSFLNVNNGKCISEIGAKIRNVIRGNSHPGRYL